MSNREAGTVVHFNHSGGYGFIRGDVPGERDVFFHVSAISEEPRIGDKVTYEIGTDNTGRRCATNVRHPTDAQETSRTSGSKPRLTINGKNKPPSQTPCVALPKNKAVGC